MEAQQGGGSIPNQCFCQSGPPPGSAHWPLHRAFSCAAYCPELVITEDICTDPRWMMFPAAAEREGLRACWSNAVLTAEGELLGTFGIYCRDPNHPTDASRRRMKQRW